jgi:hypothetical protein
MNFFGVSSWIMTNTDLEIENWETLYANQYAKMMDFKLLGCFIHE